jgi:folate-dependent phosphoribosylglycinamide formyltransferase PurN
MRILWIGGNHPRHMYYFNRIRQDFPVCGALIELRENVIPSPPKDVDELDLRNFIRHFENRAKAEEKYFGTQWMPDCPRLEVDPKDRNSAMSVEFVKSLRPNLVLIFGCGLIKEPLYSALPQHSINLHLGLSPRYRGSATLFWPFYFMEPSYAGSTFHYINSQPDSGDIIHQVVPKLHPDDGIHDVACKTVLDSAEDIIKLLRIFETQGAWKVYKQRSTGKNFLSSDFRPEHLKVIYDLFHDEMVKQYLEGKLKSRAPKLVRQF